MSFDLSNLPETSKEDWARSETYHGSFLLHKDEILDKVLENSDKNGLPPIAVTPAFGKFLNLLALSIGAKRIIEVGSLGGYSTILLARALPDDGELITFEYDAKHVQVTRENLQLAGLSSKVKVVQGAAYDSLTQLRPDPPFDLVFIDADKQSNVKYFTEAKRLVRKGGVIIVDNVGWFGFPADPSKNDEIVEGIRDLLKAIQGDPDVEATTISTAGRYGFDGFLYAIRK